MPCTINGLEICTTKAHLHSVVIIGKDVHLSFTPGQARILATALEEGARIAEADNSHVEAMRSAELVERARVRAREDAEKEAADRAALS